MYVCVCVCIDIDIDIDILAKLLNCVQFFATPWTVAHRSPLSMGFSRQEYWSGFARPSSKGSS